MENKTVDKALLKKAALILIKESARSIRQGFEEVGYILDNPNNETPENKVARNLLYEALDLMEQAEEGDLQYFSERMQFVGFNCGSQTFTTMKLRLNPIELALHLALSKIFEIKPMEPQPIFNIKT